MKRNLRLELYATQFSNKVSSKSVRVCLDDYLGLLESQPDDSRHYSMKNILSLCLMTVSVVSLSAFVLANVTVPCQRTRLWRFHLIIGGHLLAAQILYILSLLSINSNKLCVISASCSHFAWLLLMCWYPTCCVHVVQALMKSRRGSLPTISTSSSVIGVYTVSAYIVCFVFVCSHMLVTMVTSPFLDLGYSSNHGVCFITSSKMALVFLIAPGVASLVACTGCYARLCLNKEAQESSLRVTMIEAVSQYTKLCLVTLLSWISWLLYHWLGLVTCQFLHVGFNAMLGVGFLILFCHFSRNSPPHSNSTVSL